MKQWKLAVSSADEAPRTAPILLQGDICSNLREAARLGYDAIEVHTRETADLNYSAIAQTIKECGTKICMIITGRLNTEGRCNLIDDAPYITKAAMEGMKQYIDMAQKLHADLVVGWVKGNIPPGGKRDKYLDRLAKHLRELADYGAERNVKLNLEVINRYEVNVFTTAEETMTFLEHYKIENCYVHLDTFHMGIDECDPVAAIQRCKGKLGYMHFADNSRRYPGSGQFDFWKILKTLKEIDYEGYISVECLPEPDGLTASEKALIFLKNLFEK